MALEILLTLFLVLLNGFFVAAEFSIVKVRESQLEIKAKTTNSKSVNLAVGIKQHLDAYLACTQLGVTLASLGLGWVGEPVVSKVIMDLFGLFGMDVSSELSHRLALPTAFILISILHIVFGELAPKSIAIQKAEKTMIIVAYPLHFFYVIFRPFIFILNGLAFSFLRLIKVPPTHGAEIHTTDELKYLIQQSSESGTIETEEYDIIRNAFDFSDRYAKQIMIPKNQVTFLDINEFNEEILEEILQEGFSRIPCYEEDIDNVIGLIYIKDLLNKMRNNKTVDLRKIIRPTIIAPEHKKLGGLLKEFQQKHIHMAVIVNEFGSVEGIVTMEDIIEEIVGEIQDEYDNEAPIVEVIDDTTFRVYATAPIIDVNDYLPKEIHSDENNETLAGIIMEECEDVPKEGEIINLDSYEVKVLKREGNKLITVELKLVEPLEEDGEDAVD